MSKEYNNRWTKPLVNPPFTVTDKDSKERIKRCLRRLKKKLDRMRKTR